VECFADLGLSTQETARYFGVSEASVRALMST
jgi:DNA-binding CsgD family transcriptional regulator